MDFELKQIKTSLPFLGFIESRQGGRPENQDSCGFTDTLLGLLVVVCDGMGGGPGGKIASTVAVETIVQTIRSATSDSNRSKAIEAAIQNAHLKLLALQKENPSLAGMGTTATVLLISRQSAMIAHVGDSRIYQLRRGNRIFRTEDHSLVGEMVRKKAMTEDEARMSSNSNIIQRALGVGMEAKADICERAYEKGDRFVLCTDGVWGAMKEKDLIDSLARTKTLSGAMEKTMVKVDELGVADGSKHDNFTMALLTATCNSKLKEVMTSKVRNLLIGLSFVCGLSLIGNVVLFTTHPNKGIDNPQAAPSDTTSVSKVEELERQMREKDLRMTEMEKQIVSMKEKYDETFSKLKAIESTSKEVAKIVKDNSAEEQKTKKQLIAKLDELIAQLETIRDMGKGKDKDEQIASISRNIQDLSNELIPFKITQQQIKEIVDLLNNSIAKSDENDPKFSKKDQYKGHWNGTSPKGIITRVQDIRKQINN
ncbi:protein phosphatase 2C domain-containing protein [Parabacteroides sp.]|uniref:PP2C family protein-serine/threonine phosphatase n=1 Tax=Parabacteroides sp. TaxID=1869337 RepID=UPI002580E0AC|nr:protein phosphatase 2C domain-containing protein [Parabacteroides sp.]